MSMSIHMHTPTPDYSTIPIATLFPCPEGVDKYVYFSMGAEEYVLVRDHCIEHIAQGIHADNGETMTVCEVLVDGEWKQYDLAETYKAESKREYGIVARGKDLKCRLTTHIVSRNSQSYDSWSDGINWGMYWGPTAGMEPEYKEFFLSRPLNPQKNREIEETIMNRNYTRLLQEQLDKEALSATG